MSNPEGQLRKNTKMKILLNDPKLKEALGTIIDLAAENLLDPRDVENGSPLKKVAKDQQKDMEIVADFWQSL